MRKPKRESNGQYAFDGNLERLCACGHALANHSAGSPADCLFYSLPKEEQAGQPGADRPDCGCQKFRQKRGRTDGIRWRQRKSVNKLRDIWKATTPAFWCQVSRNRDGSDLYFASVSARKDLAELRLGNFNTLDAAKAACGSACAVKEKTSK